MGKCQSFHIEFTKTPFSNFLKFLKMTYRIMWKCIGVIFILFAPFE